MIRAMSTGSVPRGARSSELRHKTNSAARAALRWGPSLAAASLGGRRGESGFCVSSLAAAAVGAVTGRERRRGRGSAPGLLAPRWGGGCCRGSATPLGSPSLWGFSSWLALPRVAALMEGASATRPQPTCPFASCARVKPPARPAARRKWRGASCHPKYLSAALGCGARAPRAPRPLAAARSRPRGRRQPRQARARARAGTRPDAGVRLSVRQVRAARSVAFPPSGPTRDGGGRGARARRRRPWRRPGFQPRVGRSASQPVSQSVSQSGAGGGSAAPKGLWADVAAAGRAAHQLSAECWGSWGGTCGPAAEGWGTPLSSGVTAGARAFLAPALPAAEWAPEVIPQPRVRPRRRRRGMPRTGTGLRQPETQRWRGRRAGAVGPPPVLHRPWEVRRGAWSLRAPAVAIPREVRPHVPFEGLGVWFSANSSDAQSTQYPF